MAEMENPGALAGATGAGKPSHATAAGTRTLAHCKGRAKRAGRLCLEQIAPPRKDAPVQFNLPRMETARDAATAAGAVLEAVAEGELTPTEGANIMGLVETFRRTLETSELEARIAALEAETK